MTDIFKGNSTLKWPRWNCSSGWVCEKSQVLYKSVRHGRKWQSVLGLASEFRSGYTHSQQEFCLRDFYQRKPVGYFSLMAS